jgi:hypothetical protein
MSGYIGSKRSSSLVSATDITLDGAKLKSSGDSITKSDGTTAVLSESGGVVTLNNGTIGSGVVFPAGHIVQIKSITDTTLRGPFTSTDTYTSLSLTLDNDLQSTSSTVLIFSSCTVSNYDAANSNIGIEGVVGLAWGTSNSSFTPLTSSKNHWTIATYTSNSSSSIYGVHASFQAVDTSISSVSPKIYYLWTNNGSYSKSYINTSASILYSDPAVGIHTIMEIA